MSVKAKRVVVAMSGGVDSSVAAAILKEQGCEVTGVTMRLWASEKSSPPSSRHRRCSDERIEAARAVCKVLDVPFCVLDLEQEFQTHVVGRFCQEYLRGRTPNPCIVCNREMKFGLLLNRALALGADCMATGHYARVERVNGGYRLLKGIDLAKDQSYLLYTLGQRELRHLLFPLGHCHKVETREMAKRMGLPAWDQNESQDICFIPHNDYRSFLREQSPSWPGEVVDTDGKLLGRHSGIGLFTIGQRRGLGLAPLRPLYVLSIDAVGNRVVVGSKEQLLSDELRASRISFVQGEAPEQPLSVTAKVRYRSPEAKALLYTQGQYAGLKFEEPQRAIAPGQAVVFYRGETVVGGGTIE